MTKEDKDTILKILTEDRNEYVRACQRRMAEENGKIRGADYMVERFFDILGELKKKEVETKEDSQEKPKEVEGVIKLTPSLDNQTHPAPMLCMEDYL